MLPVNRLRGSRWPLALFGGVILVSIVGLAWLSRRVVAQDRVVERQQWLDRSEAAAGDAVTRLSRQLTELQNLLDRAAAGQAVAVPPDAAAVVFRGGYLQAAYGIKLPSDQAALGSEPKKGVPIGHLYVSVG